LDIGAILFAVLHRPGPTSTISPSIGFSLAVGMMIRLLDFLLSIGFTTTGQQAV